MRLQRVGTAVLWSCLAAAAARTEAQSPRQLYTWKGVGNLRAWDRAFGDNTLTLRNDIDGELIVEETGPAGTSSAIRDGFDEISEGAPAIGGLDLTGLSALEFDLGHNGTEPVEVQFYVQATPGFRYLPLGPDQPVMPGVATHIAPLDALLPEEAAYIRAIGINIREHLDQGNLTWTLRDVRSAGEPLLERYFGTHEPDSSDSGLQGAVVNFDQPAVEGNDGNQNQTGLSVNAAEPPPGNTGSLHWVDLASGPGAAVTWCNGTVWGGNTYNERPADMSSYGKLVVRMAATNLTEGAVTTVGVQYFLQTGGFEFHVAGPLVQLPADGEFHDLEFPIASIPWLEFVQAHGINLQQHGGGDLAIDVDHVLAVATEFRDCNGNRIPDERELLEGRSADCNSSGLPDECDIDRGTSADCDLNGVPDECDTALEPRSRVLYTWEGVGDPRGWRKQFGENEVIPANDLEGELRALENGLTPGTGWALSDAFDIIAEGAPSVGGLDLLGMTALELDLGHNGAEPVAVQFYVQATPDFLYLALGPDQPIAPGMATYTAPLSGLNPLQATYVRTIGINIRPHLALGNLDWTLNEVRVLGTPLAQRSLALHDADSPDGGLQGAVAGPERAAVEGNDGSPNQTGLSHNPGPDPPGNSGSLRWTDLASLGGGSVVWFNGTAFRGSTFNERPVDLGSYHRLTVRLAATSVDPGAVEAVEVQYFLQTANFQTYPAGPPQSLPADGQFHELSFPIGDVPDRAYTDAHGLDLGEHDGGSLVIDVDWIRAVSEEPVPGDCNGNRSPDRCDIARGLLPDADRDGIPDPCQAASFRRGDTTSDGLVDISDPIFTFAMLFLGGNPTPCRDTADANDDGQVDVSDGIFTLNSLFLGGPALPEPGTGRCGRDPSDDPMVDCDYPAVHCP